MYIWYPRSLQGLICSFLFEHRDIEGLVPGQEVAVKIYSMDMTTGFKDRLKYVDGEFRYRHTPTQNSRKAIKVWAEKELRNLKRYA